MSSPRLFVFDRYRLDIQERQLLRGTEIVPLPPKLFDLLTELIRHAGRLLQKQQLLETVWPGVAVEEGSLTRGISSLRQVLGTSGDGREFIETVPKRGYRFVAAVRETSGGETRAPRPPSSIPLPPQFAAVEPVHFVGRESELRQMLDVWERAKSGQHQLLLIGGEPGIGKTRLSLEFARARHAEGTTVLVGSCDEENLVAYQPFVESLAWYVHHCPEADLRAQVMTIGGDAEFGPLLHDVRTRIPEIPGSSTGDPEGRRYRFFEAVSALLTAASDARPLLVVIDDLHWADRPTLLLLRHILRSARTGPFGVIATYRESELARTHPLADMLVGLRREPRVTRLALRGLGVVHVTALVDSIVGPERPSELSPAVMESTDGNPFFATEMLLHLKESGTIGALAGTTGPVDLVSLGLSEGIKEVIGRRLSRLSDACNRTLAVAAVIGREFDATLLRSVSDLPESELLDALEAATRAQLVRESEPRGERFAFVHALIRETLYSELSSPRRVSLHRRVAGALETRLPDMPVPPFAELAHHFSQAASAGAADKAVDYATRAGNAAAQALAQEEALRLFDVALQSLEFKSADTASVRVDLHRRRARSFDALGQWEREVRELQAALRHLDPEQLEQRCEIVLALARASFLLLDVRPVEQYAAEGLELAERVQRADLAANAIAWLARCRQADGDLAAAIEMDRRAMTRAPGIPTAAHMLGPLSLYLAGQSAEAIPLAVAAAEAARSSGDTTFVMYALTHLGLNMSATGRYVDASRAFQEARSFGRKYGALPMLARAIAMAAGLHLSLFDFDGAEALQGEARELGRSVGFAPSVISVGIDSLLTFARRRDPGRAERLLAEISAAAASTPGWHEWLWRLRLTQARAELALAREAFDDAVAIATEVVGQARARRRPKYEALALVTRAQGLQSVARTRDAIADARTAVTVAEKTADPALLLVALDALLRVGGSDESLNRARAVTDGIAASLDDEVMRRCFSESEVVRRIRARR